jgi:hypothetical protein
VGVAVVSADDLDREQIEQLHAATLKASDSCFELKKLCATVLVPIATLVSVFTDKRLNDAVFLAAMLVVAAFWLADAVGYFYQRKLRAAMTAIWVRRAARCPEGYDHVPAPAKVGPLAAAFNTSMIYYLILAALLGGAFLFFKLGIFGSIQGIQE